MNSPRQHSLAVLMVCHFGAMTEHASCWPRRRVSRATVGLNRLLLMSSIQVRRLLCVRLISDKIKHVISLSTEEEGAAWMCHVAHTQGKQHFTACVTFFFNINVEEEGQPVFSRKGLKWTVLVFVLVQGRLQLFHSSVFFLYFSSQVSLISSFVRLVACIDVWLIRLWIHNDAHYAPLWFLICFVSPFSSHLISLYAWYSFSARNREMQHF